MAVSKYDTAIKKLLPQGSYWDNLLNDPGSDLNKIIEAKADKLATYRQRATDLKQEAFINTCNETIADYERVYLGASSASLSIQQRKDLLKTQKRGQINIEAIKDLAKVYGAEITRLYFPYTECFFAHSSFGAFMASPAAKSVVFIHAQAPEALRSDFEKAIVSTLLANNIIHFFYGD